MKIKSNLKFILEERNISIRQLSRDTGVNFEKIRILYHDSAPTYRRETLEKVCSALNITVDQLIISVNEDESYNGVD